MLKLLEKYGFELVEIYRDIRHMHLEKIATLLHWKWLHLLSKGIARTTFPVYACPSKIGVARKTVTTS